MPFFSYIQKLINLFFFLKKGDILGNVAMFDIKGNEIWERHLRSAITNSPVAGDINGDDRIDIIVGTASGNIFVLDGTTGKDIAPFPFRSIKIFKIHM